VVVAVNEEEVAVDHTEDEALRMEVAVATVRQPTLLEAAIEEATVNEALQAAGQATLTRVHQRQCERRFVNAIEIASNYEWLSKLRRRNFWIRVVL